jgi:hypothetical protein
MKLSHNEYERLAKILHGLATRPETKPEETEALKLAATALFFALIRHQDEFDKFLIEIDAPLSPEQEAKINALPPLKNDS